MIYKTEIPTGEAAAMLGLSKQTFINWCKREHIRPVNRFARPQVWKMSDLEQLAEILREKEKEYYDGD